MSNAPFTSLMKQNSVGNIDGALGLRHRSGYVGN
jgi:hypothetical protein